MNFESGASTNSTTGALDRLIAMIVLGRVDEVGFPNHLIADSRLLFGESGGGSRTDVG